MYAFYFTLARIAFFTSQRLSFTFKVYHEGSSPKIYMFKCVNVTSFFNFPSYYLTNQHKCPTSIHNYTKVLVTQTCYHLSNDYGGLSDFHVDWRNLCQICTMNCHETIIRPRGHKSFAHFWSQSRFSTIYSLWKIETEFVSSSKFSGLRTWSVFRLIIIIDLWYPDMRMLTCQKKIDSTQMAQIENTKFVLNTHGNRWRVNKYFSQDALSAWH